MNKSADKRPLLDYRPQSIEKSRWPVWLIVIVASAIGILIAAMSSIFGTYSHGGRPQHSDTVVELQKLQTALHNFYEDWHRYPTTAEGLPKLAGFVTTTGEQIPPYYDSATGPIPKDDWGNPFIYTAYSGNYAPGFVLIPRGPDGILGTADDIIFRTPLVPATIPSTSPAAATPDSATAAPSRAIR